MLGDTSFFEGGPGLWSVAIGGILTALSGLWVAVDTKRKYKSDSAKTITDAAVLLIEPLRKQVAELESELEKTEREVEALKCKVDSLGQRNHELVRKVNKLWHQVKSLGEKPVVPNECDSEGIMGERENGIS